ncbi:hypothetical protein G9P44_005708 [Scheffersomyces stipitis]|nr:hypothetical protein G9P44_005708 [Scheffersomyces stipitis]
MYRRPKIVSKSPFKHPWWAAYTGVGPTIKCKDEWLIIEISNSIRQKSNWKAKYKDPTISAKWKQEVKDFYNDRTKLIDEVIDYVFLELEWYEKTEHDFPGFEGKEYSIGCDDKIVFADKAIDPQLTATFKRDIDKLAESFGGDLDYHPKTDNKVIDLVHPSLFPLQYGITPIYSSNKNQVEVVEYEEKIEFFKNAVMPFGISKNFQWLPALLSFNKASSSFEFISYINNLHPAKHAKLYSSIQAIFNSVLPGLNYILSKAVSKEYIRIEIPKYNDAYSDEYKQKLEDIWNGEDAVADEIWDELQDNRVNYLKTFTPIYDQGPIIDKEIDVVRDFQKLKVIVKLANIELTPERPTYEGGAWHVEGTINEDIVATVLYYYDSENITESKLKFRTGFEDPEYEQNDDDYGREIFGVNDEDLMVKELGYVISREDRVVIFPNIFQHQVDTFELADKSKKGHRKILCFFIVDPYNDLVVTTDQVPPQQKEWWDDLGLFKEHDDDAKAGPLNSTLISDNIMKQILDLKKGNIWPIDLTSAKKVREALMDERTAADNDPQVSDLGAFKRQFSLCEH